jgi:hypothetical protein
LPGHFSSACADSPERVLLLHRRTEYYSAFGRNRPGSCESVSLALISQASALVTSPNSSPRVIQHDRDCGICHSANPPLACLGCLPLRCAQSAHHCDRDARQTMAPRTCLLSSWASLTGHTVEHSSGDRQTTSTNVSDALKLLSVSKDHDRCQKSNEHDDCQPNKIIDFLHSPFYNSDRRAYSRPGQGTER